MRTNKKKTTLIIGLVLAMVLMAAGYSILSTTLTIESRNRITGNWDVHINSNATVITTTGEAESQGFRVSSDGLSATFTTDLYDDGDAVEYQITVVNAGNIPAKLASITTNEQNHSNYISMSHTANQNTIIQPSASYTFVVRIYVDNPNQELLVDSEGTKFTINLNFVQYVQS